MSLKDWWGSMFGGPGAPSRPAGSSEPAEPFDVPKVPTGDELLAQVHAIDTDIAGKARDDLISGVVASRVHDICRTAAQVIPRLDQLGGGTRDAHSVMATVTSYLPEALGTYLRLPRYYADNRPVAGGKTSLMVLVDQLDLLAITMDKILDAATRRDVEALVAHGAFLADKFGAGSGGGGLDLGGQQ